MFAAALRVNRANNEIEASQAGSVKQKVPGSVVFEAGSGRHGGDGAMLR